MLIDLLNIKKNDIISIVGSGGKTSLMYHIAHCLQNGKILVTTTTKIIIPSSNTYDYRFIGNENADKSIKMLECGCYVLGSHIDNEKIIGFSEENLSKYINHFDFTIVESDGSKMKMLKGWKIDEPVILRKTTKTIGVINLKLINKPATTEIVHNFEEFSKISGCEYNQKIQFNHIKNVVLNVDGLFKNFKGEKILFINQIDRPSEIEKVLSFLKIFNENELNYFDKIIYGSLLKENFYEFHF